MLRYHAAVAAALAAILVSSACTIEAGKDAPGFKLNDQFGKNWSLADLKDSVVVIVAANPGSGRAMGPWVDNLKARYGRKICLLGLMDLHSVPFFGRGIARSRIRKETADPLMLDFGGSTAKAYQVNGKVPVVVVIGKKGVVASVHETLYGHDAFNEASAAIDKALE